MPSIGTTTTRVASFPFLYAHLAKCCQVDRAPCSTRTPPGTRGYFGGDSLRLLRPIVSCCDATGTVGSENIAFCSWVVGHPKLFAASLHGAWWLLQPRDCYQQLGLAMTRARAVQLWSKSQQPDSCSCAAQQGPCMKHRVTPDLCSRVWLVVCQWQGLPTPHSLSGQPHPPLSPGLSWCSQRQLPSGQSCTLMGGPPRKTTLPVNSQKPNACSERSCRPTRPHWFRRLFAVTCPADGHSRTWQLGKPL
jgi:hypothetical protein